MNIFDRTAKKLHKDRAARAEDFETYNYLKDEVIENLPFFMILFEVSLVRLVEIFYLRSEKY